MPKPFLCALYDDLKKYMKRGFKIRSQDDIRLANHKNKEIIQNLTRDQLLEKFWPWFVDFNTEEFFEDLEYCY